MDADELRKSMTQEVKQAAEEAEEQVQASRLLDRLKDQATLVRTRFRAINHGPERRKLDEIYQAMDGLMGQIKIIAEIEDAREREARSREVEDRANALIERARKTTGRGDTSREEVERGRRKVVDKATPGAGANTQKRIRDELNYLLNNYSPSNDNKIEMLMDKWRRSGDPSYDPAIKLRYRNVRRKKARDDYAF